MNLLETFDLAHDLREDLPNAAEQLRDIEAWLAEIAAPALSYLAQFETGVLVRTARRRYQLCLQAADRWPHALPDDAPPAAQRAAELVRRCHELRASAVDLNVRRAVWQSLRCGRLDRTQSWPLEVERKAG